MAGHELVSEKKLKDGTPASLYRINSPKELRDNEYLTSDVANRERIKSNEEWISEIGEKEFYEDICDYEISLYTTD